MTDCRVRFSSYSSILATCTMFATAVDNAIPPLTNPFTSQADLMSQICRSAMTDVYAIVIPPTVVNAVVTAWNAANASLVPLPSGGSNQIHYARNVVTADLSDVNSFVVAGNDGITNVEGDTVILAGSIVSYADEFIRGPYVVGPVTGGIAPLTRPSWFSGTLENGQQMCLVQTGTVYNGTVWNSMQDSETYTVGTDNIRYFPYMVNRVAYLTLGVFDFRAPVLSINSTFHVTRRIPLFMTPTYTTEYACVPDGGYVSWGYNWLIQARAEIDDYLNVEDFSTVSITVINENSRIFPV